MSLNDYLRILIRRGWIIAVAVVLTAGCAYLFTRAQAPVYRATQKILINPARNDFGLAQTLRLRLNSYAEYLNTNDRAQEVITRLNEDMTAGALNGYTNIVPNLDTGTLNIDVDLPDPARAQRLAREYGVVFIEWLELTNTPLPLSDRIEAELLDQPSVGPRTNTSVNLAAGALLGLIVGGVIVFVLEYLAANVLHRAADIERYLELPVLGSLPNLD
jgi:capsular polysaccharide biosynthesis protein